MPSSKTSHLSIEARFYVTLKPVLTSTIEVCHAQQWYAHKLSLCFGKPRHNQSHDCKVPCFRPNRSYTRSLPYHLLFYCPYGMLEVITLTSHGQSILLRVFGLKKLEGLISPPEIYRSILRFYGQKTRFALFAHWHMVPPKETSLRCYLGLSVKHLIGATQDEWWRQGHAFAAQHYLAHCGLLELASPITSYFWYLFAAVGRNCSHCSPPATPPCGHRLRQRMPRFLAMKPQKFAPFVHRTKPLSGILQGLAF